MYDVVLSKVRNGANVRTDTVNGITRARPRRGQSFCMVAPPLDEKAQFREIRTSTVLSIRVVDDQTVEITTRNSVYSVRITERDDSDVPVWALKTNMQIWCFNG